MFSVLVVVLRPDHIAGLGFSSGQRIDRAANDAAGLCWRLLMTVFGPFCMTHSFPNGEICSMRHTKDENQRWWHVRHPFMAEPSNNEFAVEKGLPRKCSRFSGADRFGRCRLHAEIYEPIVNYLGIAGGIVKRGSALETSNRGDHSMLQFPPDQQ